MTANPTADKPRGERLLRVFICHGCQTCWHLDENDNVVEHYPHYLSPAEDVTEQYVKKEAA
jgi:hypothetical protein